MKDLRNKRVHRGNLYGLYLTPENKDFVCGLSANEKKLKKKLMANRHKLLVRAISQIL